MRGPEGAPTVPLNSGTGRFVLATTVLGSAAVMLVATVVNVALPSLADDLQADSAAQQWVVNGYLLTLASLILVGGSLGDRYGRRRMYRLGLALFSVASLACALAPTTGVLIALRLIQGVGAALLAPGSLAIIEATIDPDDRGRAIGAWSGLGAVAGAGGPLLGGVLVEVSWRWVFVVGLPVALVAWGLSVRVPETLDRDARGHRVDVGGAVLTTGALGALSFALIGWPDRGVDVLIGGAVVVSVAAAAALWRVERRRDQPMVPVDLFSNRVFVGANVVTLLVYAGLRIVFLMLSIQLQVGAGWSPVAAGAALLPVTLLLLVLSPLAGDAVKRVGVRLLLVVGPSVMAVGLLLMAALIGGDARFLLDVLPATVVFGLGLAASVAPVTTAALGSVPERRSGAASGVNNAVARTGQLLAVAAIPPAVGLSGGALSDPGAVTVGFPWAMVAAAGLVGAGAVAAALLLPPHRPGVTAR